MQCQPGVEMTCNARAHSSTRRGAQRRPHTPAHTRTHPHTPAHTRTHPHTPAHTHTHPHHRAPPSTTAHPNTIARTWSSLPNRKMPTEVLVGTHTQLVAHTGGRHDSMQQNRVEALWHARQGRAGERGSGDVMAWWAHCRRKTWGSPDAHHQPCLRAPAHPHPREHSHTTLPREACALHEPLRGGWGELRHFPAACTGPPPPPSMHTHPLPLTRRPALGKSDESCGRVPHNSKKYSFSAPPSCTTQP